MLAQAMGFRPQEDGVLSFPRTSPPLTAAFLVSSSSSAAVQNEMVYARNSLVIDPRAVLQLAGAKMVKLIGQ